MALSFRDSGHGSDDDDEMMVVVVVMVAPKKMRKAILLPEFRGKLQHSRSFSSCVERAPLLSAWGSEYLKHCCPLEAYLHSPPPSSVFAMDSTSSALLLEQCSQQQNLSRGMLVHAHVVECHLDHITFVANFAIQMYTRCESLREAWACFVSMSFRNGFSWNLVVRAYARRKEGSEALRLFDRMQQESILPSRITYISGIDACSCEGVLGLARRMHARIAVAVTLDEDVIWATSLINMYGKCGNLAHAMLIFERMDHRNILSWTSMISSCERNGRGRKSFFYFREMEQQGMLPNKHALVSMIASCASDGAVAIGKQMHVRVRVTGLDQDAIVGSALITMYGKCDDLPNAGMVFDSMATRNVVTWTTMIETYSQHGHAQLAFALFDQMQESGVEPNMSTFAAILGACADPSMIEEGKKLHDSIKKSGFEHDLIVWTTLLHMYAKCGSLEDAESMFASMQGSDVVLWNSMIGAYALYGMVEKAIELFDRMQRQGVKPNKVTFINMLVACSGHPMALREGMQIHHCILDGEFDQVTAVGNALISAYSKCACMGDVRCVFDKMPERNVFSWSTLISAYANHGFGRQALYLFTQMQESGVPPDKVTFIGLLAACSRAGLLDEAYKYFVSMGPAYGILPISDHYFCMVDALCRTGCLNHAEVVMKCMPFQPVHASFSMFLSACRHNPAYTKQGEEAAFSWHELDRRNLVPYLMLGYIYTASGWVADASALVKGLRNQIVAERERNIKEM